MTEAPFGVRRLVVERGACTVAQHELGLRFAERIEHVQGAAKVRPMVSFVYEASAISARSFEMPLDAIDRRSDWYRVVNEATESLARRTLRKLLDLDPEAKRTDALVVVSATYAGFPALSRRLQEALGLPLETACFDLSGLGCAGATQGWSFVHALLESRQARRAALLLVDAMGTFSQSRTHATVPSMEEVVAHCLASDGAAALSIERGGDGASVFAYAGVRLESRLWPGSLHLNDLTADARNAPYLSVGGDIRKRVVEELAPQLGRGAAGEPVFFHPGGAALMRALVHHDPRFRETAEVSLAVLAEHGNVGASSAVWVLDRAMARGMAVGPRFRLVALGPGIVTTILEVDGVERGKA